MQHLPDVVRTRLDTWYPSHLPARFRPRVQPRSPRLLRPLPLALAALLLVLLAAGAAAGPTRALTDAIVNLAGSHPAATPTPRARSDVRSAPGLVRPAAATITVTPIPANPAALAGPSAIHTQRTASGSRTMAPLPTSNSMVVGTPAPPAQPSPSPLLPDSNPSGSPDQQPSPPPVSSPSTVPAAPPS
ncbi:MAG: hypothetical protein DLM67_02635 [Candidatus Nephthysia bennettiae]|nr:MAG: hypothetical protein DLM67_02635 [Candidatus Dormibacteraeota bacterium]